ncbi:MAG TPA: glycoside hydrolase family 3 C-terminal domain-containing protein, partial [Bryobacteraceae bacterium]
DPYFNGRMAAAEIKGIQSQGPIADANMYLTMNQESGRFHSSSAVDERTLQEIYLPPFADAIQVGHVGTVMCAYVKTNRTYSCQNSELLTGFLRKQLGFEGWVMSDWGGTHSTVASSKAGLDQEMPGGKFYGPALKAAVQKGKVSTSALDEHVRRILVTMFRHGLFDKPEGGKWSADVRSAEDASFSRKVAEQGTVLLKNAHDILPLSDGASIAMIGAAGRAKPKAEGGGSSHVIAAYVVSPFDAIHKRAGAGTPVSYAEGSNIKQAVKVARAARVAVVFANTNESEGKDRINLELPGDQNQLIAAVASANPNTIVVLDTGGPVLMPWINSVRGVIEAWYPGQEDGNAIAAVLFGNVNPGGRLTLTFPRTENAVPTNEPQQWPGINDTSVYSEKLDVGYRWYDATNTQPLFPFGYGLSYTAFKVSDFRLTPQTLSSQLSRPDPKVVATLNVTNTGHRAGAEVVEAYVKQPVTNGEPPRQLCGFAKVFLNPGQTKSVELAINPRAFSIYSISTHKWISPAGTYEILVGTSSRDLPLHRTITVDSGFTVQK